MAYSFGAGTGETAESLKRKRAYVMALLEGAMGGGSNTVGEGISTIGRAVVGRAGKAVLDKREREGRSAALGEAGRNPEIRKLLLGETGGGADISGTGGADYAANGEGGDYFSAIRSAESGGNDNAKNPLSSATGRYQFTSGTWNELARNKPELGLTPDGRTNPDQQERAIRAFTSDNARILASAGIEPTGGNLYAAHFLGAGGARSVLSQPDSASVAAIVGPSVVKANPFLRGMSVGDFRQWSARKGGGNNTLQGGEGNDMLDPIQTAGVTVGLKTPDAGPAPMQRPMPDDSRFGPAAAPKADRLPQPGAFNPMQASGPMAPPGMMEQAIIQRAAQSMPQQMRQPAPQPQQQPPQPMQPDPMQTAAVPRPQPRMPVGMSPRMESTGYGPNGVSGAQQAPQGGGLLARLLMRQPMPQGGGQAPQAAPQGNQPIQAGQQPQQGDDMAQMYALLENPYLPEGYRNAIMGALEQQQKQRDPSYQADLAYKQAQTRALENPEPQFIPGKDGSIFRADKRTGSVEQVYGGRPDNYRQLSNEEELARGLDPAGAYQVDTNDKVYKIGGEGTTVNIDQKAEGAFDKKLAEKQAETFDTMATEGLNARADLGIIGELDSLLKGNGGALTGVAGWLAQKGIGGDGMDDLQAAQALINKLVPTQRAPGSGSMSDRDVELFTRSLPSLWNTPGGNEKILGVMRGLAQYKQAQGEIADMVLTGEMSRQEARQSLRKLPNPLAEFGAERKKIVTDGYTIEPVD